MINDKVKYKILLNIVNKSPLLMPLKSSSTTFSLMYLSTKNFCRRHYIIPPCESTRSYLVIITDVEKNHHIEFI